MPTLNSIADRLTAWGTLINGMKLRAEELVHLKEEMTELEAISQEVERLITQTDHHEARFREFTQKRAEAELRGAELYGRLVAALRGKFGKRSLVLHEFGIQPNALPGPKKPDEPGPTTPPQEPASQAT